MGRYKLVTFDITNTLLKFSIPPVQQYCQMAKLYRIKVNEEKMPVAFKKQWQTLNLEYPNFGAHSDLGSSEWWTRFVKGTFRNADCDADESELVVVANHLIKLFATGACWEVVPGSDELLKHLRGAKLAVGVISNFDERLNKILEEVGLRMYFDFVVCSYLARCAKPSPEIFNLALGSCSFVKSNEAIHIGDNVKLDYLAARNAGWDSALIVKRGDVIPDGVDPNFVVDEICNLENIILS